jgi:3-mercaptopyruvate sulfurtransferase SseA
MAQVKANIKDDKAFILDARSAGRFDGKKSLRTLLTILTLLTLLTTITGKDPEPWGGISSGHMPQAINVPFTDLVVTDWSDYLTIMLAISFAIAITI